MRGMKEVLKIPSKTFWAFCKRYHLPSSTPGKGEGEEGVKSRNTNNSLLESFSSYSSRDAPITHQNKHNRIFIFLQQTSMKNNL